MLQIILRSVDGRSVKINLWCANFPWAEGMGGGGGAQMRAAESERENEELLLALATAQSNRVWHAPSPGLLPGRRPAVEVTETSTRQTVAERT